MHWIDVNDALPEFNPCGIEKVLVRTPVLDGGWGIGWYSTMTNSWSVMGLSLEDPRVTHWLRVLL